MNENLTWIKKYRNLGWRVIPIVPGQKRFKVKGTWDDIRSRDWNDSNFDANDNIGLDPATGGLVDVDLDCWEAVAIGELILPKKCPYIFGRKTKPRSHFMYPTSKIPMPEEDLKLVWQGETILELRTGAVGHTRIPPSIHTDKNETKEAIEWYQFEEKITPPIVTWELLRRKSALIAATTLTLRYYPAEGARHDWALAYWGSLRQLGVTREEATQIFDAIRIVGPSNNDIGNREMEFRTTYEKPEEQAIAGLQHLRRIDSNFARGLSKFLQGTITVRGFISSSRGGVDAGNPKNHIIALERAGLTFTYDKFSGTNLVQQGSRKRPLEDSLIIHSRLEIHKDYGFLPGKELFYDVISNECWKKSFNPVLDYLDELKWDGEPRINTWLSKYCGAINDEYSQQIGRLTLLAAVNRIVHPGSKFDQLLVLEGIQGSGKSSTIRALCPDENWFSDSVPIGADPQKVIEITKGKWLVEISDLFGMSKREVETVKAFLSRQTDEARKVYAHEPERRPRMFICIGTTNRDIYLNDPTGNRRFWPIKVGNEQDVEGITRDRDQLWAEAAEIVSKGCDLILPQHLWKIASLHQGMRAYEDPWTDLIISCLLNPKPDWQQYKKNLGDINFTLEEMLSATGKDSAHWDIGDSRRIIDILKRLGCEKTQFRRDTLRQRGWRLSVENRKKLLEDSLATMASIEEF